MKLYCAICQKFVGVFLTGSKRKGVVMLCAECVKTAENALQIVEQARQDAPDFIKGMFR